MKLYIWDNISQGDAKMCTKKTKILLLLCFMTVCVIATIAHVATSRRNNYNQAWDEERYRIRDLARKIDYADGLNFHFKITRDGESSLTAGGNAWGYVSRLSPFHDPFYTDVVFVHSEEEALGFPEYVIVA